jgi:ABC-type antimicrobial peptide transport system permease subunit
MAVLVRASGNPASLVSPVQAELGRIDPTLAPYDILTMPERRTFTSWEQRLFGNSFALFGTIALVLALCGIYGVIAYSVTRRTWEIRIRVAMGARPGEVQGRVVGQALLLTGVGAAFGLMAAIAFARALRGILYGVDGTGAAHLPGRPRRSPLRRGVGQLGPRPPGGENRSHGGTAGRLRGHPIRDDGVLGSEPGQPQSDGQIALTIPA